MLSKLSYSMGLFMLIYMFISGSGRIIRSMLSNYIFIPLSKLTYQVYLCHAIIMHFYFGSIHSLYTYTDYSFIALFINFVVLSYLISFLGYLLVEKPILNINYWIIKSAQSTTKIANMDDIAISKAHSITYNNQSRTTHKYEYSHDIYNKEYSANDGFGDYKERDRDELFQHVLSKPLALNI